MGVTDHGKHESPYKLVSWLKMFHKDIQAKALQQNLPFIGRIKHLQAMERLDQCSDSVVRMEGRSLLRKTETLASFSAVE